MINNENSHKLHNLQTLTVVTLLEEGKDDSDNLLQGGQPLVELGQNLLLVLTKLGKEVLSVWTSLHCELEHWLDDETVVLGQSLTIGIGKGLNQLEIWVVNGLSHGLGSELQTTGQPQETLCGLGGLLSLLVDNEVLEVGGLVWGGQETGTNLVDVTLQVVLNNSEGRGTKEVLEVELVPDELK